MKSEVNTMATEIMIAENRIKECENRRAYFAEQFYATGNNLYKKLAENETDTIAEIRQAIIEALV